MKILDYKKTTNSISIFYNHTARVELTKEELDISKIKLIKNISRQKGYPVEGYGLYKPMCKKERENVFVLVWKTDKDCD